MPLPYLLLLASALAAVAFFLAGFLLAPRRSAPAPEPTRSIADRLAAPAAEVEDLRRRLVTAAEERDQARAAEARLALKEKTTAERLRAAEDANREAFEREEKAAEAWAVELDAAKAEQKRHDRGLEREVEELRAKLGLRLQGEQEEQRRAQETDAERQRLAQALEEAVAAEKRALTRLAQAEVDARTQLAEVEAAAQAKVAGAEAAGQERIAAAVAAERARLAAAETVADARLAEAEAAYRARMAAAEEAQSARLAELEAALAAKLAEAPAATQATAGAQQASGGAEAEAALVELRATLATAEDMIDELHTKLSSVESERGELAQALARESGARQAAEEARQELDLRRRAAEEVVEILREQVASGKEAVRGAETAAKERDRLAEENAELRAAKATAEHEAQERAGHEDAAKDVLVELAAAQAKLAELASMTEENRRLRDEIAELRTHQEASAELERLTAAHKQVRLDAELMARRLQELLHDQAELAPVRAQAAEAVTLAQEVEYLRRREKDLEAQLYAAGAYASREMMALSGELPVVTPVTDLETNLTGLVGQGGPRTAVLADRQGFLIASAGESVAEEGLAAFAAVAGDMVARARQLLPLADVESVRVTDANRMVLTCHLFASAGEPMGMATLGPGDPPADKTAQAIAGLAAIVAGAEPAAETPEPEPPASGGS